MSAAKSPAYHSFEPSPSEEKLSTDGYDDLDGATSMSYASRLPLSSNFDQSATSLPLQHGESRDGLAQAQAAQSSDREGLPSQTYSDSHPQSQHPRSSRGWDLLGGARKFGQAYEQFDPRNASEQHLAFADGDLPNTKFVRFYQFLLNASIVTRWTLFIIPVLIILWIPGILSLTSSPKTKIWGVRLLWWSIWLTVAWGGWWASLAVATILPRIARHTVGVVAVGARRYIDWLGVLRRYVALFGWTLAIWVAWNPFIDARQDPQASPRSKQAVSFISKLLFGIYICAALLLFEKFSIQWIAAKFHQRSYAERIAEQKFAMKTLTTLYRHSTELPEHPDSELDKRTAIKPTQFVKQALKGVRYAATTTTTVLGNVASEIAGSSVLQPNSPQSMVLTALESAHRTKLLARRIFFSFRRPDMDHMVFKDISRFFSSLEEAGAAFSLFDRDGNGDVTLEETEQACGEFHREQLSIERSMRDLDSAVGRLDNLFMSLYVIIAILIIAVTLEAQLTSLVTAAGSLILGLSWLIGSSLHDVLTSIIFLFVLHPFDVGDGIDLGEKGGFTVKEIRLLSTILLDGHGTYVQVSNIVLSTLFIRNIRRSPKMSESFSFEVGYSTTFKQIERLRGLMLGFVQSERRDFQPLFDISVVDIPAQETMVLTADIMYKSNWQLGALKATRRNKWICALKTYLAEAKIYGPKGNPDAIADPTRYTVVPWEEVQSKEGKGAGTVTPPTIHMPSGGYNLMSRSNVMVNNTDDLFGESVETHPPRRPVEASLEGRPATNPLTSIALVQQPLPPPPEEIEMISRE